MFRSIVLMGIFTLICLPVLHAQPLGWKNHFGIKAGFSAAMLIANDVESSGLKPAVHAGVFYEIVLTDHLSIQPELLYSSKGGNLVYNGFIEGKVSYTLNYIELPLLAVYNFTPNVNLHAGGYISSLRGAHAKNGSEAGTYDFAREMKRSDFNNLDRGFVLGLGARLGRSTFGLRYQYGLLNIGKARDFSGESSLFPDARTFTFNAYIGVKLL